MSTQAIYTRALNEKDYSQWQQLFLEYRQFYQVTDNEAEIKATWDWLLDPSENIFALVCVQVADNGAEKLLGFMHYFEEISSIVGKKGGFLNDLYVSPTGRGQGIFEKLFAELQNIAKTKDWSRIQWRTAEDNYRARSAYDRISAKTVFLTYRLDIK